MKISFRNDWGNQHILMQKKTKRSCHQKAYLKRMAKGNSLNIREMIKEGNLEH